MRLKRKNKSIRLFTIIIFELHMHLHRYRHMIFIFININFAQARAYFFKKITMLGKRKKIITIIFISDQTKELSETVGMQWYCNTTNYTIACLLVSKKKKKPIEITFDQSSNYWRCDGTLWVPVDECGYRHDRTEVLVVTKLKTRVIIPNSHDLSSHPVVIVNNSHAVFIQFSLLFNLNEEKPIFKKIQFFQSLKQIYCFFFFLFTSNVNSFGEYKSKYFIAFYATN